MSVALIQSGRFAAASGSIVSENFNRADGALGTTTSGGQTYINMARALVVSSNKGVQDGGFAAGTRGHYFETSLTSYTVKAKFTIGSGAPGGFLACRIENPADVRKFMAVHFTTAAVELNDHDGLAGTITLVSSVATTALTADVETLCEIVVTPTAITAKIGGATITTWTNSTYASNTKAGFGLVNFQGVVDDVEIIS